MNVFHKVTLQSLKKNRTRTVVTVIGIILSAAMICAVTTFASSMQNYALQYAIYNDGDWHGSDDNTAYATYETVAASDEVKKAVYLQQLGYAAVDSQNEYKPYLYLLGASGGAEEMLPIHITKGSYPASVNEILLPDHLAANGGVRYQLGDTLTLELGERLLDGETLGQDTPCYTWVGGDSVLNDEELRVRETRTYTVVGFYERPEFEGYTSPGYTAITLADETPSSDYLYDVYFKMKHPKDVYAFMEQHGFSGKRNADVLMYSGVSQHDNFQTMLYSLAAIVIGLIMFGSISLIYNAFSISVSERTKQFGLLSSVGATKKQLRKMVFFEAFAVSIIGIPLGIFAGVAGIGVTLLFIGHKFQGLGFPMDLKLHVSVASIAVAAVVALVTVLLSAWIPSKRATRVSAVEAIRQNQDVHAKGKPVKTSKLTYLLFGLPGMLANKHYKRSKKKYRATIISLFMSIVLFVSASAFTEYLVESVEGGFGTAAYDLSVYCSQDAFTEVSKEELLTLFREDTGVTDVAYTQSSQCDAVIEKRYLSEIGMAYSLENSEEDDETTTMFWPTLCFIDDTAYKNILKQYALEEAVFLNPEHPVGLAFDGGVIFDSKQEKFITAQFLSGDVCEATLSVQKEVGAIFTGETYEADDGVTYYRYWKDEKREEFFDLPEDEVYDTVAIRSQKTIYEKPYFLGNNSNVIFVYPDSMKAILFPDDCAAFVGRYYFLSEDHSESYAAIQQTLSENGFADISMYAVYDHAESVESERNLVTILQVFAYGFIVLISLIAAANVFNTISTNIALRRREFAMLKSVGMTEKGFQRMMNFECLLYGSRALLYGLPVSAGVTYLIYRAVSEGYSTGFRLPWGAIGIAVLSVFAVVFATMLYSMGKIKKDNPIDALKNENL